MVSQKPNSRRIWNPGSGQSDRDNVRVIKLFSRWHWLLARWFLTSFPTAPLMLDEMDLGSSLIMLCGKKKQTYCFNLGG